MRKTSQLAHRATVFGAVVLSSALSFAQNTQPAPVPAPSEEAEEEVVELSPFEVTASSELGYQERETLAGTRIRTELGDVGSAISVVNSQFLQDTGATTSQDLLVYTTGTEVGGVGGNFMIGSLVGDAAAINDNDARLKPQGNTRVRGLDAADNTRDFFITDIPWDSYNTGRIDIQRGANSILFGNGSPAGIINGATDGASFGRNSGVIEGRFGSFGSYRGSLNINRVLIDDQLAVRFATLLDKDQFRQTPAFNEDRRVYGALRFEPEFLKRGSARTTFRASFEHGDITANRPRLNTINDAISSWFLTSPVELRSPTPLGRPAGQDDTLLGVLRPMISHAGYDPFVTGIANANLDTTRRDIGARATFSASSNPNAEAWLGAFVKTNESGASTLGPGIDVSNDGSLFWMAVFQNPDSSNLARYVYPTYGNIVYNAVNSSGVRDGNGITGIRTPDLTGLIRLDQYSFRGIGSLLYTLQGVWRAQTITDPSVFDFYNQLLDGPNKREGSRFDAFNVAVDQTFWNDHAGFQVAYDKQRYSDSQFAMLNNPTLTLDVYRYLPAATLNTTTGLYEPIPNPDFGRPYIVSRSRNNRASTTTRETIRVTPFLDLNFKELLKEDSLLTKLLGRHAVTGLYERNEAIRDDVTWAGYVLDAQQAAALFGPNRTITGAERTVGTISYIGPDIHSASSLSGLDLSPITALQQPQTVQGVNNAIVPNAYYFDSTWTGAALPGAAGTAFTPPAIGLAPNAVGGSATQQAENPTNYRAWAGTPRTLSVTNADFGNQRELSTAASSSKSKVTSKAVVDQWHLLDNTIVFTGGLRKDEVKRYTPGNPLLAPNDPGRNGGRFVPTTTGAVDWDAPFEYPTNPSSIYTSDWLKTYSIMLHTPEFINDHLPWGMSASVFYSKSENFRPVSRKDYITGADLTPPNGDTKDYGFALNVFDGRVSLKVNWYETTVNGASLQDNSIINFTADEIAQGIRFAKSVIFINDINNGTNESGGNPGLTVGDPGVQGNSDYTNRAWTLPNQTGTNLDPNNTHWFAWEPARAATSAEPWTLAEWQAEEAHALAASRAFISSLATSQVQQFMSVWGINPNNWDYHLGNNNITSNRPAGAAITGDTFSKGREFELFIRPTDSWNISINAAKTFATRLNLAGNAAAWLNTRWELYNEVDPNYPGGLLAGDVRWFGGGQGNVASGNARFGRNGYKFYSEFHAKEGVNVPELRPWRFNLVSTYNFNGEFLKGFFVGGGYRWEDKSVVGYGVTETDAEVIRQIGTTLTSARAAIGKLDVTKPFYGPTESHVDLWAGYNRKLAENLDWRIQLNVRNAFESKGLVPISVNPDGSGAAYRIAEGMTWELSSSLRF